MSIIDVLNTNRQTGTTTALVECVEKVGGYLIVGTINQVKIIIDDHPNLKGHIFSLNQISNERGLPKEKIFFDTTAIYEIISNQNKLIKIVEKGLEDLGYMGMGSKLGEELDKWREI